MAQRMTPDEWAVIRARWEADPRDGYAWIVSELGLRVSDVAVLKRARNEGWAKKASLKTIVALAQTKADEKTQQQSADKVSGKVSAKVSALTFTESVDLRADVIQTHRAEWYQHRDLFNLENMHTKDGLTLARTAKTAAEMVKIRQDGERKAWGLDVMSEDTTTGVSTLSELDAMFAQAVKKAGEMQEALIKDRSNNSNSNNSGFDADT